MPVMKPIQVGEDFPVMQGKRQIIQKGERIYVSSKVNKRNYAGAGRGLVGVYDNWQRLLGYVTLEQANKLRNGGK